jgi:hypothetical protein
MKINYGIDTASHRIKVTAGVPRTGFQRGEGELEVGNQGRSRISTKSFSQETEAIGQQTPRIGDDRPKLREDSAGCTRHSDSTPQFLFSLAEKFVRSKACPQ